MAGTHTEELVYTESEDGVALAGAVIRPAEGITRSLPVVWIHGFTGRFYEPHAVAIGRELARQGYVFVTGNNRGHDVGTMLGIRGGGSRLGGAAWEELDESPYDVDAWISYAVGLGFPEVALLGHSLGGMKVTHYQAVRQDPRVRGLVIASGPVWRFVGPAPEATAQAALAERLVAEGRGLDLLPRPEGQTTTISAQRVVGSRRFHETLFGLDGREPAVARVRCPIFAFLGTEEPWLGTAADLDWLKRTATASARVDQRVFAGADHCYVGHETEVGAAIADWVGTLG